MLRKGGKKKGKEGGGGEERRGPVVYLPLKPEYEVLAEYWIVEPYAKAVVAAVPELGGQRMYFVQEVQLSEEEERAKEKLVDILSVELRPPESFEVDVRRHVIEEARRLANKYRRAFRRLSDESWGRVLYYIERDLLGYGPIDAMMRDPYLEDISCDGVGRAIHVWHRDFESIPSNVVIVDRDYLREFVVKLAHMAGKHISAAFPIVDAMLPGRHRLAATFGEEVSPRGSTFTIRKFREKPFSIVELLASGHTDAWTAAYMWLMLENKMSFLIMGSTAAGKTTTLNALTNFLKPGFKIVTIEETPELNLPHENWVQLVSRESYGLGGSGGRAISLFDLVKLSLRYRPDYIIVGEVRGEEAFVLFQAAASVSGDTPVLVKGRDGAVKLVPIGEFVDKFYSGDEEWEPKVVEGYYVLSHEGFRAVWKPIRYVLRHKAREIYEVVTEGGGRVEATGSHSVFILDPATLDVIEKPVASLKPGEFLITFVKNMPPARENGYAVIDVIDLLRDRNGIRVLNLPEELRAPSRKRRNSIPLEEYLRLESRSNAEGLRSRVMVRLRNSKYVLPARIQLDEDLAFVFGAYIADGCVKRGKGKRICFTFGAGEVEIANRTLEVMQRKFGLRPAVDARGSYTIYEFNHTLLAEVFEELLGRELREKRVPPQLWASPPSVIREFFKGLMADSRRTLKRRYVVYSTASRSLALQFLWLARVAGFYSELFVEKGSSERGGMTYNVAIYFNREYKYPNASERIPVEFLARLRELAKPRSMPLSLTYVWKKKCVSKKTAMRVIKWISKKGRIVGEAKTYLDKLLRLLNSDIVLIRVKEVRRKPYNGFVYDLSVPGTESFFGGNVPVLLHNTGHGGMCTIHAESIEKCVQRLTSPPMNVSPAYIPAMNIMLLVERVWLPEGKMGRRLRYLWEVEDYGKYRLLVKWDPRRDVHEVAGKSLLLEKVSERLGRSVEELEEEIERRMLVLRWMVEKGITDFRDVARHITQYYVRPRELLERARRELSALGVEVEAVRPVPRAPLLTVDHAGRSGAVGRPRLPEDEESVLSALRRFGGELDSETLREVSGLRGDAYWRVVRRLAERGLVVATLTYVDGRPRLGFKLSRDASLIGT